MRLLCRKGKNLRSNLKSDFDSFTLAKNVSYYDYTYIQSKSVKITTTVAADQQQNYTIPPETKDYFCQTPCITHNTTHSIDDDLISEYATDRNSLNCRQLDDLEDQLTLERVNNEILANRISHLEFIVVESKLSLEDEKLKVLLLKILKENRKEGI